MDTNENNTDDEFRTSGSDTTVDREPTGTRTEVVEERSGDHRPDDAHLTDAEVSRVRRMLNDGSVDDGASRIKWFLLGFLAALVALVVAAAAFLVISDDDNDGTVDLEVPTVDVGG